MIKFPVLTSLQVRGYQLYPGTADAPGLNVAFNPGVTLVLGANGLGKSTLILMVFRMLTGDADLRLPAWGSLGAGQLEQRSLYRNELRALAARVEDGAAEATASLAFFVGETRIEITRELASLALTQLIVNDETRDANEADYRAVVTEAAEAGTFLNWLFALRYLVFYFDDRRSLVWDPSAQRRMLPLLFLSNANDDEIEKRSDDLSSRDSAVRNLAAALFKQEKDLRAQERALAGQPELRAEIARLQGLVDDAEPRLRRAQELLADLEAARSTARLQALRSAENRQEASASLDQARMAQIRDAFPSAEESAVYLLARLIEDGNCAVCGNSAGSAAEQFRERLTRGRCLICDSPTVRDAASPTTGTELGVLQQRYEELAAAHVVAVEARERVEAEYLEAVSEVAELSETIAASENALRKLSASLPEGERALSRRREAIAELRSQNTVAREAVIRDKLELARLVAVRNEELSAFQSAVKERFERHSHDFLVEQCSLVWSSHTEQIGQLGAGIPFAVFQIDMTSGVTSNETRREGAQQVSESQREFIDIAFRMALVEAAGPEAAGTIVVDAPESSLDAVFAPRAAEVLTSFGAGSEMSRVLLTSNLVDGQLIPKIAELAGLSGLHDPRVVNLFEIAAKTAALREHGEEYQRALDRVFTAPGSR